MAAVIPHPSVPVIDTQTGLMTTAWYQFSRANGGGLGAATGVYDCTATYAVVGGVGQYTLTPTVSSPIALTDGLRLRFTPGTTADTGLAQALLTGVSTMLTIVSADGAFCTFQDFQKNKPATIEYSSAQGTWVAISSSQVWSQEIASHGSVGLGGGGFGGGAAITSVNFGPVNGGNILLWNTNSAAYRMCRLNGGVQQQLFNGSAYVNGAPGQSLLPNTFYYVFAFNENPNSSFSIALDFSVCPVGSANSRHPTDGELGFLVMNGDVTRTYVGMLYTINGGVGFIGSGNNPQMPVYSNYNPTQLPLQTDAISFTTSSATDVPVTNATTTVMCNAASHLPEVICRANYTNTSANTTGSLKLQVSGVAVSAGLATAFTVTTMAEQETLETANGHRSLGAMYGKALSDGFIQATPLVNTTGGSATFVTDTKTSAWQ